MNKLSKALALGVLVGVGTLAFAGCTATQNNTQQISVEQGMNILEITETNHKLNVNGEWNNMTIRVSNSLYPDSKIAQYNGKTSDGRYFRYGTTTYDNQTREDITIEIKGEDPTQPLEHNTEYLCYNPTNTDDDLSSRFSYTKHKAYINAIYPQIIDVLGIEIYTEDNLKSVTLDDNGIYEFTFINNNVLTENENHILTIAKLRITKNYRLVSQDIVTGSIDGQVDDATLNRLERYTVSYSYGDVNIADIEARINELFAMYKAGTTV